MTPIFSRLTFALLAAGLAISSLPLNAAINPVTPSTTQQEESWTINLKGADIREFIEQIAQITGKPSSSIRGSKARSAWYRARP